MASSTPSDAAASSTTVSTLVNDARVSLGELREVVDRYVASLGDELKDGGSLARKLADDAAAAHTEVSSIMLREGLVMGRHGQLLGE